jgi:SNF2 family DNA or RNA helicase
VGLGKTIEAGLVLSEYVLRGRVGRALVLVPASLVGQWREELESKFAIATRTTDDEALRRDPDRLWQGQGVVVASLATARSARHRDAVISLAWDLVIVDEAHGLKNHRTESYALVERLRTRFLLLLTATPVENRVEELYNLVTLVRPGHLGGRAEFVRRFAGPDGRPPEAARDELRVLLADVMVRNTRALSGVALPPRFARTLLVAPGPDEGVLYEGLASALRSLDTTGRVRPLLSLLLQEAGSSPLAVRGTLAKLAAYDTLPDPVRVALVPAVELAERATGSEKARALLGALSRTDGPAIVFTRFRGTLGFLADVLGRAGIPHERLDGDVPGGERAQAIERCRATGGVLLSTDVGSEGLNLQFCHRVVNFDVPWNPMRLEQRIGRLHRIGQEHPVEVLTLCLAGSIEERILAILDERINLFELVVGEIEMILGHLEDGREFPDLALEAFAQPDEDARARAFERLGAALAAARQRHRAVQRFDEALFRSELAV